MDTAYKDIGWCNSIGIRFRLSVWAKSAECFRKNIDYVTPNKVKGVEPKLEVQPGFLSVTLFALNNCLQLAAIHSGLAVNFTLSLLFPPIVQICSFFL